MPSFASLLSNYLSIHSSIIYSFFPDDPGSRQCAIRRLPRSDPRNRLFSPEAATKGLHRTFASNIARRPGKDFFCELGTSFIVSTSLKAFDLVGRTNLSLVLSVGAFRHQWLRLRLERRAQSDPNGPWGWGHCHCHGATHQKFNMNCLLLSTEDQLLTSPPSTPSPRKPHATTRLASPTTTFTVLLRLLQASVNPAERTQNFHPVPIVPGYFTTGHDRLD